MVIIETPTAGTFTVDATISITETLTDTITEHPVETGTTISDHVLAKPITIKVEGVIGESGETLDPGQWDPSRPATIRQQLKDAREAREPCTVSDDTTLWENYAIESLEFPRDKDTGDAIKFTATFKQILFADSKVVAVVNVKATKDKGHQPATQANGADAGAANTTAKALAKGGQAAHNRGYQQAQ